MPLNEALADLRTTIAEEGYTDDTVALVAGDWDLNPVLLQRKFQEKFGVAPAAYVAPAPMTIDYEAKYNAGMQRAWKRHPKMFWSDLTAVEQQKAREFLDRHLTVRNLHILWK